MADIKDLPGVGSKFKATLGRGNFKKKLYNITRYGSNLRNLKDNRDQIIGALEPYQRMIKVKGGLSRKQGKIVWRKIKETSKEADKTITKGDRREIKQIIGHFRSGNKSKESVSHPSQEINQDIAEQQKRRNITESRMTALEGETSARVTGHGHFAGGKIETRSRVALNKDEIGRAPSRFGLSGSSLPNPGMANPSAPGIGGLGPRRFL